MKRILRNLKRSDDDEEEEVFSSEFKTQHQYNVMGFEEPHQEFMRVMTKRREDLEGLVFDEKELARFNNSTFKHEFSKK